MKLKNASQTQIDTNKPQQQMVQTQQRQPRRRIQRNANRKAIKFIANIIQKQKSRSSNTHKKQKKHKLITKKQQKKKEQKNRLSPQSEPQNQQKISRSPQNNKQTQKQMSIKQERPKTKRALKYALSKILQPVQPSQPSKANNNQKVGRSNLSSQNVLSMTLNGEGNIDHSHNQEPDHDFIKQEESDNVKIQQPQVKQEELQPLTKFRRI